MIFRTYIQDEFLSFNVFHKLFLSMLYMPKTVVCDEVGTAACVFSGLHSHVTLVKLICLLEQCAFYVTVNLGSLWFYRSRTLK